MMTQIKRRGERMDIWQGLNERQQAFMQAIFEVDQFQEREERRRDQFSVRKRRPADEWRWMEYGVFESIPSPLYHYLKKHNVIDEGTGSTFNALERRGYILTKYSILRRNGQQKTFEHFLMVQITAKGRKLARAATGKPRVKPLPVGTLREWHWKALVRAWEARPQGLIHDVGGYGRTSWKTWLRLRDYIQGGQSVPLIDEYLSDLPQEQIIRGPFGNTHTLKLTAEGEQFYRENWQRYKEMYPEIEAPDPN